MITYELAKELKDAGFPQPLLSPTIPTNMALVRPVHYPTLSELIEACGQKFSYLKRFDPMDKGKYHWEAYSTLNTSLIGGGSTPEEALANLWLALNKKS